MKQTPNSIPIPTAVTKSQTSRSKTPPEVPQQTIKVDPHRKKYKEINKAIEFSHQYTNFDSFLRINIPLNSLPCLTNIDIYDPNSIESLMNSQKKVNQKQFNMSVLANTEIVKQNLNQAKNVDFHEISVNPRFAGNLSSVLSGHSSSGNATPKSAKSLLLSKMNNGKHLPKELDPIEETRNEKGEINEETVQEEQENNNRSRDSSLTHDNKYKYTVKDKPKKPDWMKTDKVEAVPVKEVTFTKIRTRTPNQSQTPKNQSSNNSVINFNLHDIPLSQSQITFKKGNMTDRSSNQPETLGKKGNLTDRSNGYIDQDDESASRNETSNFYSREEHPYSKPLPYFQYSINRYKSEFSSQDIPERSFLATQLKNEPVLNPGKLKVDPKMVESQYSKKNLEAFLTNDQTKWNSKDQEVQRLSKNLTMQYTNTRFLQPKPGPGPKEDAGKRNGMPITPKGRTKSPIMYSPKKENMNLNQSIRTLVNMMDQN